MVTRPRTVTPALARRTLAASTALLVTLALSVGSADAFAPTKLKSLGSNNHESVTEVSFKALSNEFFSITKLTKPMEKAMKQMTDANAAVDKDQDHTALHFDGENFPGGQSRIVGLFGSVVTDLKAVNAEQARRDLGGALHTIQDFYSHSNWVELGNTGPSPDLGRPGHTLSPVAGLREPTCAQSTLITDKLTSGYYSGEDRVPVIPNKCRHGGPFDKGAGRDNGINKDLDNQVISPHYTFHAVAAAAATEATQQFIRDIKAQVTQRQLKLLFGVGPTLGMSIDTTGGMGDIIEGVKGQAIQIVKARAGTEEEPSKFVLAPFNDPSTVPVTTTDDPDVFKSAISGLGADGGDDCPEPSMTGMLETVSAMDEGSDLFTFTDAGAKDGGLADSVASLAGSKDIRIYPMLFGACSSGALAAPGAPAAAGTSPNGPQATAAAPPVAAAFTVDPAYTRVARGTGGQVFSLARADAGTITQLADALVRSNAVNLLNVTTPLTGTAHTERVPVDSTLTSVTFSASGADALSQTVVVKRPDGTIVAPGDPGVRFITPSADSAPVTIVTVTGPAAGEWTVSLSGFGSTSLRVTGESTLDLTTFRFLADDGVSTDPTRFGVEPIDGFPVAGAPAGADAVLTDGFASARFDLRKPDGTLVQTLSLPRVVDNEFAALVTVPSVPFLVYVTGTDVNGKAYQRMQPDLIEPQSVVVTAPPSQSLSPGTPSSFEFSVRNLGTAGTFTATASDDHGYVQSSTPAELTVAAHATGTVTVVLQPPATVPDGTTDTLTVSVVWNTQPDVHNFAVLSNAMSAGCLPPTPRRR